MANVPIDLTAEDASDGPLQQLEADLQHVCEELQEVGNGVGTAVGQPTAVWLDRTILAGHTGAPARC